MSTVDVGNHLAKILISLSTEEFAWIEGLRCAINVLFWFFFFNLVLNYRKLFNALSELNRTHPVVDNREIPPYICIMQ